MRSLTILAVLGCCLSPSILAAHQSPSCCERRPLPSPRGRYAVGTTVVHMTDSTRATARALRVRPLTVQIWYPAKRVSNCRASYLYSPTQVYALVSESILDFFDHLLSGRPLRHLKQGLTTRD